MKSRKPIGIPTIAKTELQVSKVVYTATIVKIDSELFVAASGKPKS
jgi:hypothetical protein